MVDALKSLIAKDGMTINQIANSEFLKLSFENMGWSMPVNNTISKILIDEAKKVKEELKIKIREDIDSNKRFSVVMDEWTSLANIRFMSVILRSNTSTYNTGVVELNGSLNSDRLTQYLDTHLREYGIDLHRHIVAIVSDGAAVMKTLQRNLPTCEQICLSHGIHLAVLDTFVSKKKTQRLSRGLDR